LLHQNIRLNVVGYHIEGSLVNFQQCCGSFAFSENIYRFNKSGNNTAYQIGTGFVGNVLYIVFLKYFSDYTGSGGLAVCSVTIIILKSFEITLIMSG